MLIDTHCHLDFPDYDADREQVITRSKQEGVDAIINIGSSLKSSYAGVKLASEHDFIYASVGVHPHDADKADEKMLAEIRELSTREKVVAVGEIGLDYYRNLSTVDNQKRIFVDLISLAKQRCLPIIIHCRDAQADVSQILEKSEVNSGVVHCFSGDEQFMRFCLDLGLHISFTCNLTYKKAHDLRELAAGVPMERLLLETDAPFLPPEGLRGRRNEPAYVKQLAQALAKIKGVSVEEIARVTTENAKRLFKIK